jgi:hypothetical protein
MSKYFGNEPVGTGSIYDIHSLAGYLLTFKVSRSETVIYEISVFAQHLAAEACTTPRLECHALCWIF